MESILHDEILSAIQLVDKNKIYDIRLRIGQPVIINYDNKKVFLSTDGITSFESRAMICKSEYIEYVISFITENSLYAFNEKIKRGYLTTKNGIRVGLAGECVFDNDIVTIKNFSSLNIRIPHEIVGCSDKIFPIIKNGETVFNTLIISPPFRGKTTILKDLARRLNLALDKNILIIDERQEFRNIYGKNIDKIENSNKLYAFSYSVRSLSPEIIITDELSDKNDYQCALEATHSGIKIIASCHAESVEDLKCKSFFIKGVFDRYLVLKSSGSFGELQGVYDKDLMRI